MTMATTPASKGAIVIEDKGSASANVRALLWNPSVQEQMFASLPESFRKDKFAALCLDQFEAMASQLNAAALAKIAKNPQLVLRAAQRTAALGLIPGKGAAEVAWIFRNGWAKKDGTETPDSIDVMPQWQAYQRLMRQAPGVLDVETVLVHKSDDFTFHNGEVVHNCDPFEPERVFLHPDDPACATSKYGHGLRGGYVKVTFIDGRIRYHLVPFQKIDKNRMCSKDSGPGSVWAKWYPEQCLKTTTRDAAARRVVDFTVDQLERMAAVAEIDNETIDVTAAPSFKPATAAERIRAKVEAPALQSPSEPREVADAPIVEERVEVQPQPQQGVSVVSHGLSHDRHNANGKRECIGSGIHDKHMTNDDIDANTKQCFACYKDDN